MSTGGIQTDRQGDQSEIQKFNSEIRSLTAKLNSNAANQNPSAVRTSPQSNTVIRLTDVGQPTRQVGPVVPESGSHISHSVNDVSVRNVPACNDVYTNTTATSCTEAVRAQPETFENTSQYTEMSLPNDLVVPDR